MLPFIVALLITIGVVFLAGNAIFRIREVSSYVASVAVYMSTVVDKLPEFVNEDADTLNALFNLSRATFRYSILISIVNIIQLVVAIVGIVPPVLLYVSAGLTSYCILCGMYLFRTKTTSNLFNDKYEQIQLDTEESNQSCQNPQSD